MPSARSSAVSSSSSGASTPLRGSNRSQLSSYEQRRKRSARNSGWSSGTHSTQASSPKPNRCLVISDDDLETLADETASTIQWEQILDASSQWKWKESVRDFSIYTKQDGQRYAVLAVGVLPCSVAELRTLMHAARNEEHIRCMDALHGSDFREGEVVHNVDLCTDGTRPVPLGRASAPLVQLSVKTATVNKTSWLSSHEEWCYIDAVYDDQSGDSFEKLTTSLDAEDVFSDKPRGGIKQLHNVVAGYLVHVEKNNTDRATDLYHRRPPTSVSQMSSRTPNKSRVYFYAEMFTPRQSRFVLPSSRVGAAEKAVKYRLLQLTRNCSRFLQVIRSRRLGVQVLAGRSLFLPPLSSRCLCCSKMLLIAKLCRLCGHIICEECSKKYDRERLVLDSPRMKTEKVRVCNRCIARVDHADYSNVVIRSLRVPKVVTKRQNDKPAEAALSEQLQDELNSAPTKCKKERVMNVIKHMISSPDVESTPSSPCSAVTAPFATHSSDPDFSHALERQLKIDSIPDEDNQFANTDERKYQVDPGQDVEVQMTYPVPNNEEQRLRFIKESRICEMGKIDELDIICNIATKEVDCLASLVTIIGKRDVYIAASSMEALQQKTLPRADVFCAHSIMDTKPFVLPYPEADVRFHKASPVFDLGARFYCGFPLLAGDDSTVIGSVCCIDTKSRELTEGQYTSLSKLAATASKVVKLQTLQRRNSASEQLRTYDSEPPLARHS